MWELDKCEWWICKDMGVHGGDFIFMYFAALTGGTKERNYKHQTDLSLTVGIWNDELANVKEELMYYSAASVNLLSERRVGWIERSVSECVATDPEARVRFLALPEKKK
jgi:hypothetical protein